MDRKPFLMGVAVTLISLSSIASHAEPCPMPGPGDAQMRRPLAKEWFSRAEDSEAAGHRDAAVKQYACSMRLVPHPSTAFNLAMAAERSGDPSMAADAFRAYLRLLPDAPDRAMTQARIVRLENQVADLRRQFDDPVPPPPLRRQVFRAKPTLAQSLPQAPAPRLVVEHDPDLLPPLPMPSSPDVAPVDRRIPPWPFMLGAAATAGTGLIFNLVARAKMNTCRDPQLRRENLAAADEACSGAPPYAYSSYALLGLGGALGVAGAVLIYRDNDSAEGTVTVTPTQGGGAFSFAGKF